MESSDLSANSFADEVAAFCRLPRVTLPQLLAAASLVTAFSPRFLRETTVFPYRAADGGHRLVLADPTDKAAVRAAEIVLGGSRRDRGRFVRRYRDRSHHAPRRHRHAGPGARTRSELHPEDDVESLRDLASGAPVVRAVNDLLEKAAELRATDIHLEPFRNGLVVRMRVDGLLRAMPTPAGALPQALISRVKILSGLNIAERRCRRTAPPGCASRAPNSTSASPPCRRSTAKPP